MTKALQKQLDSVIGNVNRKLAREEFLIPQKTNNGIQVGDVLIVSEGAQKHISKNGEYLYKHISLNKVAIKVANLIALGQFKHQQRIDDLIRLDGKFGAALADYQLFKDRLAKAKQDGDMFRIDMYLARLIYSKDSAEYWKKQAVALAG